MQEEPYWIYFFFCFGRLWDVLLKFVLMVAFTTCSVFLKMSAENDSSICIMINLNGRSVWSFPANQWVFLFQSIHVPWRCDGTEGVGWGGGGAAAFHPSIQGNRRRVASDEKVPISNRQIWRRHATPGNRSWAYSIAELHGAFPQWMWPSVPNGALFPAGRLAWTFTVALSKRTPLTNARCCDHLQQWLQVNNGSATGVHSS